MKKVVLGLAVVLSATFAACSPFTEVVFTAVQVENGGVLPPGVMGKPYTYRFAAAGGFLPYTFTLTSGALPNGITLNASTGVISGMPLEAGDFTISIRVTDSSSTPKIAQIDATMNVSAALDVSVSPPLPDGVVGMSYGPATLTSVGGSGTITWSVQGGTLPRGLSLAAATGVISGTPTRSGSYDFLVAATETGPAQQVHQRVVSIVVAERLSLTAAIADGVVGAAYSFTLPVAGGIPPYSISMASGPAGLSIAAATGVISGTPTAAGDFAAIFTVTDSATPAQVLPLSASMHVATALAFGAGAAPDGVLLSGYSFTPAMTGGTGDLTFRITGGALPSGLVLDSTSGSVVGSPTVTGLFTYTMRATDSGNPAQSVSKVYTFNVSNSLVSSAGLPEGTVGVAYSGQLTGTGGLAPYTWTPIPAIGSGLSLASDGSVSGTPTGAGGVSFTATTSDSAVPPQVVSRLVTIGIFDPLVLVTTSVDDAVVGTAYSASLSVTGGHGPFTYAVTGGTLPAGLSLNAATGAITGTATAASSATVTITVSDSGTPQRVATGSVSINARPQLVITTATLPDGSIGQAYSSTVGLTGGTGPFTFAVVFGTVPAGLTLTPTTGLISGSPTVPGSGALQIRVTDSGAPAQIATATYTANVFPALSITTSQLPDAVVGTAYSASLSQVGGLGPFTYALTSGSMPAGLSLDASTGVVSGMPTAPATASLTFSVTGSANPPQTSSRVVGLNVRPPIVVTTATLMDGVVGLAYSDTIAVSGGLGPHTFLITSGALPAGLSLDGSTGVVSGTPTSTASSTVQVQVTDSSIPAQVVSRVVSVSVYQPMAFSSAPLKDAVAGAAYSDALAISGGKAPFTFSLTGGSMSPLVLNAGTGAITGTAPIALGTSTLSFSVTDSANPPQVASRSVSFSVWGPLQISTATLADGAVGVPYSRFVTIAGGKSPTTCPPACSATFDVAFGLLPRGLSLNAATGEISGTPTIPGSGTVQIRATDTSAPAQIDIRTYQMNIRPKLELGTTSVPNAIQGSPYSVTLSAVGGNAPYSWVGVSLPAGMTLSGSTGVLSGTPTSAGVQTATITLSDSASPAQSVSVSVNLTVLPQLAFTSASMTPAVRGAPYSFTLATTGGVAPLLFSTVGFLPAGLQFNSGQGIVAGSVTAPAGTYNVTFNVGDSGLPSQHKQVTLSFRVVDPLDLLPASLPVARAGDPYTVPVQVTGGNAGSAIVTWNLLPAGLTFSGGQLLGPASPAGSYTLTGTLSDPAAPAQGPIPVTRQLLVEAPLVVATSSLPSAVWNAAYSASLSTSGGGTGTVTWSEIGNTLGPNGLSLNAATGVISGVPNTMGPVTVTVQAQQAGPLNQTASRILTIQVRPPLVITTSSLRTLTRAVAIPNPPNPGSISFVATGGFGAQTWTSNLSAAGLSFSSAGVLTGTPSTNTNGTPVTFTVTDTDNPSQTASVTLTLRVRDNVALVATTPATPPDGVVGQPYSHQFLATGGIAPLRWEVLGGSLPAGLTLNQNTGLLSGSAQGVSSALNITVRATDSAPAADASFAETAPFDVHFYTPIDLPLVPLADGSTALITYSESSIGATGGTGTYTYTVTGGALPKGVSINSATAVLTGFSPAPTKPGSYSFLVTATDTASPPQSASTLFNIFIGQDPLLATWPAVFHVPYNVAIDGAPGHLNPLELTLNGGTVTYAYSITGGALPAGLSPINWAAAGSTTDAHIGGTANVDPGTGASSGPITATLEIVDSSPSPVTISRDVTIVVHHMDIVEATWPLSGVAGRAITPFSLTAREAIGPVTWAVTANPDVLPPGLSMASTGQVSGTIGAGAGSSYTFDVTATDSAGQVFTRTYTMDVYQPLQLVALARFPDAYEGQDYGNLDFAAYGIFSFDLDSVTQGGLPPYFTTGAPVAPSNPGVVIPAQGSVTGTIGNLAGGPDDADDLENYTVQVSRTDSALTPQSVTTPVPLTVYKKMTFDSSIVLVDAVRGRAYLGDTLVPHVHFGKRQVGPASPYVFDPIADIDGSGLSLAADGTISGTTNAHPGDVLFTATAHDLLGQIATSVGILIHVADPLWDTTLATLPDGEEDDFTYSYVFAAPGGTGAITYQLVAGAFPPGLDGAAALNAGTGTWSGIATTPGTYNFTIRATDSGNPAQVTDKPFTITINTRLSITTTAAQIPDAVRGSGYSFTLQAANGTGAHTWSHVGTLPDGLSLNTNTGEISGTVLGSAPLGGWSVTFTATDSLTASPGGGPATASLAAGAPNTFVVNPITLSVTQNLRGARENYYDGTQLTASGGRGNYTFTHSGGVLPPGTGLFPIGSTASTTADIEGLATTTGQFGSTIMVEDLGNPHQIITAPVTINIDPPIYLTAYADISGDSAALLNPGDLLGFGCDDGYWEVTLPYSFRLSGQPHSNKKIYVSTNGFVTLDPGNAVATGGFIPSSSPPNSILAARWEDLWSCEAATSVHANTYGQAPHRITVIQWKNIGYWSEIFSLNPNQQAKLNFEVVLHETSNAFQFLYGTSTNGLNPNRNAGLFATVGWEDENGVGFAYNPGGQKISSGKILTYARSSATSYGLVTGLPSDERKNAPGAFTSIRVTPLPPGTTALNTIAMGDDTSQNIPIGFAFPFYGTSSSPASPNVTYDHASVSPNGGLVLSNGVGPAIALPGLNQSLSLPGLPGPVIAPFWDDLTVQASDAPLAWVGYKLEGDPLDGNARLIIEWNSVALSSDVPLSRLSFQAILYQTTGQVEFTYGAMLATGGHLPEAKGSAATVGIADGVGRSRDSLLAGSLNQGNVIKFLPTEYGMQDYAVEALQDNFVEIVNNGLGKRTNDASVANGLPVNLSSTVNQMASVNLGFSYDYFGSSYTAITLNSNGVLIPEANRTTNLGSLNMILGTPAFPNNVIAPFWENLDPTLSGGDIKVLTIGTAPNRRFVAQWSNVDVKDDFNVPTGDRVTFEAIIGEGPTPEIEFIYGGLVGGSAAHGSSASIGLENVGGTSTFALFSNPNAPRQTVTPYGLGSRATNGGGLYEATQAGVSGLGAGPVGTGTAIVDGSVVWTYLGLADQNVFPGLSFRMKP